MAADSRPSAPFKVRPARRGDASPIVALLAEVKAKADTATVTWILSHPEMEVLVAADLLDKVVGFVTLSHRPLLKTGGRAATLDELLVTETWRKKGVGQELMKRAVERARVLGVKRLEIQSFESPSAELVRFFASCGFDQANVGVFRLRG